MKDKCFLFALISTYYLLSKLTGLPVDNHVISNDKVVTLYISLYSLKSFTVISFALMIGNGVDKIVTKFTLVTTLGVKC